MIAGPMPDALDASEFEKNLYLVRRRIEKRVIAAQIAGFYICSLSCRSIIYKGLFLAESLSDFYPDLRDERFESRVAIFHQRYSTNTFPQWWLAQPFPLPRAQRRDQHDPRQQELDAEPRDPHGQPRVRRAFGGHQAGDPGGRERHRRARRGVRGDLPLGRDAPTAKLMLVPEAMGGDDVPESHDAMYRYLASVMEPWDGPAALAMTDGRWAVAGMDRNALRPLRYTRTSDGLLIVGSETGMVQVPESAVLAKGRLGPQMIAVDLDLGVLLEDRAIKDRIAGEADYAAKIGAFVTLDDLPAAADAPACRYDRAELTRRQVAAGQTLEDMELILAPMVETAKEAIGSMGDDTPLAVISDKPRLISQFFRQNFSQVTNPPDRFAARTPRDVAQDAVRQSRQHPRRRRHAGARAGARQARC